jgi:PAS domain S-box-containing protein
MSHPSDSQLFAAPRQSFRFHHLAAGLVAAAVVAALAGAVGVAQQLRLPASAQALTTRSLLDGLLEPALLLLLSAVAALVMLCLWVIVRYERRLEVYSESRARNRAIVDNMLDGAIHIDALGRIAGINASAERIFGYRTAELRGQPLPLLFAPPVREHLESAMQAQPALGLPPMLMGRHQAPARRRDGGVANLSWSVSEVHVGGYLVYTAVVRPMDANSAPLPELPSAGPVSLERH